MLKILVDVKKLKEAMSLAFSLPGILDKNLLLTATADSFFIELASGGAYLKYQIPAEVFSEGSVCLDGERLHSLALTQKVEIEQISTGQIRCKAGRLNAILDLHQDNKVEPQKPYKDIDCTASLPREILLGSLDRTNLVPAIPSPTHGVRFLLHEGLLAVSCTDGYRGILSKKKAHSTEDVDVLLKPQAVINVLRQIGSQTVHIGQSFGMLKVMSSEVEFFYPSIQADPEDVEGIFLNIDERTARATVQLVRKDFELAIKEAVSVCGSATPDVRLTLTFTGTDIVLYVKDQTGEATSTYECSYECTERFGIVVSPRYVLELLGLLKEDAVSMLVFDEMVLLGTVDRTYQSILPTVSL